MHWSHNTAERHLIIKQNTVCFCQNTTDAQFMEEQLPQILHENGHNNEKLLGKITKYNANNSRSNSNI